MGEHKEFYPIDRPDASAIFLRARHIAGEYLEQQIELHGGFSYTSSGYFKWIKAELTYPSFDNFTLAYKNKIFSIAIDIIDNDNKGTLPRSFRERLVLECKNHDLIPCLFPIKMRDLSPLYRGWNLIAPFSHEYIDPILLASDELSLMSDWEKNNFAIQIVRNYLSQKKMKLLSFCGLLGIRPQIWFEDSENRKKWVYVKNSQYPSLAKFDGFDVPAAIKVFDGFFAGVSFMAIEKKPPSDWKMYRDKPVKVNFTGLRLINSPVHYALQELEKRPHT